MLEYFSYKKVKKHQAEKRAQAQVQSPLLNEEDENFLERIVSAEGTPPPLPNRPLGLGPEAGDSTDNNSQMVAHNGGPVDEKNKDKGKRKENEKPKDAKKSNRFSFLSKSGTKKASVTYFPGLRTMLTLKAGQETRSKRISRQPCRSHQRRRRHKQNPRRPKPRSNKQPRVLHIQRITRARPEIHRHPQGSRQWSAYRIR
jgi:hypothetical protein